MRARTRPEVSGLCGRLGGERPYAFGGAQGRIDVGGAAEQPCEKGDVAGARWGKRRRRR